MSAVLDAKWMAEEFPKPQPDADRVFSRATSADDDSGEAQERQLAARLTSDSLPSAWGISDKEEGGQKSESESEGECQALKWSRSKLADGLVIAELPAAAAEPEMSQSVDPEVGDGSYSRSLMLTVRLSLARAAVLPPGPEPLGLNANNISAPPGLSLPVEAQPESCATQPPAEEATAAPTTVMLRNLPNQCTRPILVKWLGTTAFSGDFDLVYVPMDRTSGNNLGYAFINFVEAAACERFTKDIHGTQAAKCFPGSRSSKVLNVCAAKVQGKEPYSQALENAKKASELAAPQPMGGTACSLRVTSPKSATFAWCSAAEAESTDAKAGKATAEADQSQEPASKPTTCSTSPVAAFSVGLRADAPAFVPRAQVARAEDWVDLLGAFAEGPAEEYAAHSHAQAAVRAQCLASQLFVPPAALRAHEDTRVR